MNGIVQSSYEQRVGQAAEAALKRNGSVGPLELFQEMRLLQPAHVAAWRRGVEDHRVLEPWIQVGPAKFQKAIRHFQEWATARGLRPVEVAALRRGPGGIEPLLVTAAGDPAREKFYRTHYVSAELPEKKTARLVAKLNRPPELVVFEKVSEEGHCSECGTELLPGDFLLVEKARPLCLTCADLDELVFLSAGDAALTRRARQHSALAAVVVRFSRGRNRYERQGLLVTEAAVAQAEKECAADAPERAAARARAVLARAEEDREFVAGLAGAIASQYPGCPGDEARRIAEHTGRRHSGRVGRTAAGRAYEVSAVALAVVAHIRHSHTDYDELLRQGTERLAARTLVREKIEQVLLKWSGG